jgi:hypothetical protein
VKTVGVTAFAVLVEISRLAVFAFDLLDFGNKVFEELKGNLGSTNLKSFSVCPKAKIGKAGKMAAQKNVAIFKMRECFREEFGRLATREQTSKRPLIDKNANIKIFSELLFDQT